ncbi:helix-turn-helix transcriptional regulator [Nocardioides sp. TRM66260-LWL]|uniref:winged helix-turn-helix transcriptional regulator n=1 Tax=Nocardioides sp. TRM66260-LWL TaxID=2874478 RepID=UPI001CC6AFD9|nr:helix-turn-helix domain-containing protein [Nocardioides sp. TRM66260-LWL]MBZ5734761.1 helix-turn-helix transcriptional regulator [Nocardioides sp. TRM66260-LWL]
MSATVGSAGPTEPAEAARLEGELADRDAFRPGDRCPIARALGVVGTRSAMLIVREAFYGTTRFDDFAARVEITPAVAAARLKELTEAGILRREPYREPGQRTRHEYRLTPMGLDLAPVVLGLFEWGGRHLTSSGRPPLDLVHDECGAAVHAEVRCESGHPVPLAELRLRRAGSA